MMRNLIVLGCAGLLACGLALTSFAGGSVDTDGDGVNDEDDNCVILVNGPLLSTGACDANEDGDLDGFGNPCDTDYNNNGATDLVDVANALIAAAAVSTNNIFDNNCNGAADLVDTNQAFQDAAVVQVPGPSGKACAGTIPCP
jgi:hypothetical protein